MKTAKQGSPYHISPEPQCTPLAIGVDMVVTLRQEHWKPVLARLGASTRAVMGGLVSSCLRALGDTFLPVTAGTSQAFR